MTEPTTIEQLTHTVQCSRKVSDGNYGSTEATIFMQVASTPDMDTADLVQLLDDKLLAAEALVLDRLGIEYEFVDGQLVETNVPAAEAAVRSQFPAAAPVPAAPSGDSGGGGGVGPNPPFDGRTKDRDERKQNSNWAQARYSTHPGEFWDNRQTNADKGWNGPDFKHKDSGAGFWLN